MGKLNAHLSGIPETMLISLRARALETQKQNGIISDPKSVEILDTIEYNFTGKEVSAGAQLGVAIRTEILDQQVTYFMQNHPDAAIVNLGCGLDTRFHRIDNGTVVWYDLDVPEAIELRRHFFPETTRFHYIAKSMTDYSWLPYLPKKRPILFVAEGLFMYFHEREIKDMFSSIGFACPGAEMLFEAMAPFMAKRTDKHPDVKKYDASFKWGITTGAELEYWGLGIEFIKEWYYFDRHRNAYPLVYKLLARIPAFRKGMKIVHIRLGSEQ